jgi:hypothetical protein
MQMKPAPSALSRFEDSGQHRKIGGVVRMRRVLGGPSEKDSPPSVGQVENCLSLELIRNDWNTDLVVAHRCRYSRGIL